VLHELRALAQLELELVGLPLCLLDSPRAVESFSCSLPLFILYGISRILYTGGWGGGGMEMTLPPVASLDRGLAGAEVVRDLDQPRPQRDLSLGVAAGHWAVLSKVFVTAVWADHGRLERARLRRQGLRVRGGPYCQSALAYSFPIGILHITNNGERKNGSTTPSYLRMLRDFPLHRAGVGRGGILFLLCPGQKPPFLAVTHTPRPYESTIQKRFTMGNAKGV
jgi:hypothetical protein